MHIMIISVVFGHSLLALAMTEANELFTAYVPGKVPSGSQQNGVLQTLGCVVVLDAVRNSR